MPKFTKNGYYYNTIYGRKFRSYDDERSEGGVIVVIGLLVTLLFFLFR